MIHWDVACVHRSRRGIRISWIFSFPRIGGAGRHRVGNHLAVPHGSGRCWYGRRRARFKKVIFLGFDGLDPGITEKLMAEGRLPNFARLRDQGSYRRLRTTFPALSPVAWSTFATGVNPAKHNIFDFLNRDLRTYAPELSRQRSGRRTTGSRPSVEMRRKSEPFWKILGRHAVRSTILRVPVTFPPEAFNGRSFPPCVRRIYSARRELTRALPLPRAHLPGLKELMCRSVFVAGVSTIQGESYRSDKANTRRGSGSNSAAHGASSAFC